KHRKEGTIVSSNTSGISIEAMIEDCSEEMKAHFLGTHFFNPPRYVKLLEVIPTKHTDPEVLKFMQQLEEDVLGKGVVAATATPQFTADRIGTYRLIVAGEEMLKANLRIIHVASASSALKDRPTRATVSTLHFVGLPASTSVANNTHTQVTGDEQKVIET